ncbi:hypothetical protein CG709_04015, partial [Lachnotalea glycerini]
MGKKQLTLVERWELDIKAYEKGVNVKTTTPQRKKGRNKRKKKAKQGEKKKKEKGKEKPRK